jgi:hypothetical protein
MKPTNQQEYCIELAKAEAMSKIEAGAGAGKTSTLKLISENIPARSLYLAFNKVTAVEAEERFPAHVMCMTTHSLAYRAFGIALQSKLSRPKGAYKNVAGTGSEIARFYGIKDVYGFARDRVATAAAIGLFVKQTVENFQQSADSKVAMKHVPFKGTEKLREEAPSSISAIHQYAVKLWEDRINPGSEVLATHDTYLKLYQLSKPRLSYEVLYVDEFQDTTPCVLDIVLNQKDTAKIIIVGDRRQAIYGWRGAVNAMQMVDCKTAPLSQSFRYGQGIADVASAVLDHDMTLTGRKDINCTVGFDVVDRTKPHMYLFRTNTLLLIEAVEALGRGEKIKIEIDVKDFVKMLQSADALYRGDIKNVKHEEILPYATWYDFIEEMEQSSGGPLKRVVGIIEGGTVDKFIATLESYVAPASAIATYTTAHKAKGREEEQVMLADDFASHYDKGEWKGLSEAEQNLLYVAVTRAKRVLGINRSVWEVMDKFKMPFAGQSGYISPEKVAAMYDDIIRREIRSMERVISPDNEYARYIDQ